MITPGKEEQRLQLMRAVENSQYLVKKYLRRLGQAYQQLAARWQRRKEVKLYHQWVEQADLPPEAIPAEAEKAGFDDAAPQPKPVTIRVTSNLRYFLLVIAFLMVCAALIVVVARFC